MATFTLNRSQTLNHIQVNEVDDEAINNAKPQQVRLKITKNLIDIEKLETVFRVSPKSKF